MKYVLSFDVGTGSVKSALYNEYGHALKIGNTPYPTHYGAGGIAEQDPEAWWSALVSATKSLVLTPKEAENTVSIGISGHSMGCVPIDRNGNALVSRVPIWNDTRAEKQAKYFFKSVDMNEWYQKTGNGLAPCLYSIFKIMWFRDNLPQIYCDAFKFVGTKDYLNSRLTGLALTDGSYASGSGVYSLIERRYIDDYIAAAGIDRSKLPGIIGSADIVGNLTVDAANALGLPQKVTVVAGGVDNVCTALGANCKKDGDIFASLGSSSQVALSSEELHTSLENGLFVWEHCVEGKYLISTATMSSGSALGWALDRIAAELKSESDPYSAIDALAATAPVGSNGVMFCPTLSGGSATDPSQNMLGGFAGLSLATTKSDILRSILEGIAMELKLAFTALSGYSDNINSLMLSGGGAKSELWRSIYADVLDINIVYTSLSRNAATLGAAALALTGNWLQKDYRFIDRLFEENSSFAGADSKNTEIYAKLSERYYKFFEYQAYLAEK